MKGTKKRIVMRLTSYASLITAATLALAYALGLCDGSSAAAVLALLFEVIGLGCWWISGGRE